MADEVDAIMEDLHERLRRGMEELSLAVVEKTRDTLSVPVERDGSHVIRSAPGESPRKDSGDLYNSISNSGVQDTDDGVSDEVGSDVWYAYNLQHGTDKVAARPYLDKVVDEVGPNAAEFVAREMKG